MTAESSRSGQSNLVTVESSLIIDAPVARVWAEVANFNNVAAWHPDVTESQLEAEATGHSPGEIRSIKLRNGAILRERLVEIDPEMRRHAYSVLDDQLPLRSHISWVTMRGIDEHHTKVTWTASFEPAGLQLMRLLTGSGRGSLNSVCRVWRTECEIQPDASAAPASISGVNLVIHGQVPWR